MQIFSPPRHPIIHNLKIVLIFAVLFSMVTLLACNSRDSISLEEKAQEIDKLLICPVCPAETIAEAQVPIARDMRLFVRQKLNDGWNKKQILDYLSTEDRYGVTVLAEPPKTGFTLLIWVVPPLSISLAILVLYFTLKAMQRNPSKSRESYKDSLLDHERPIQGEFSSERRD
ncbi:uncharacterized protein METZ01_LOCUS107677 [marine metagenome]|jgi:cytochrome c-type biogenesis protein CcmH|uniref:CcmH/CycL/Ccl2/NrfF N-terminal domain-containing protein n=1 Tax=marine metagenome TaxID=408172 RepID=A0A381WSA8_9ZZZZ